MAMPLTEPARDGPRFERKRLLTEEAAVQLQAWTALRCSPDPYADACDPVYLVESLYWDSADLAIWRSSGPARMARYRLRRYNAGSMWFLEEKLRRQDRVWKRRVPCRSEGFAMLSGGGGSEGFLPWFAERFRALALQPAVVVAYRRHAWCAPGDVRITFDRQVDAWPAAPSGDPFAAACVPQPVVAGVVLEVKHPGPPTTLVRELAQLAGALDGSCSKYGRAVQVLGLAPPPPCTA